MYITPEVHDMLWQIGMIFFVIMFAVFALMILLPKLWEASKWMRMHIANWWFFKKRQMKRRLAMRCYRSAMRAFAELDGYRRR